MDVSSYNAGAIDQYTDFAQTSEYAKEAVKWAVGTGIFSGEGTDSLDCTGNALRKVVAKTFMNLMLCTE
jgi:hypothetical protein